MAQVSDEALKTATGKTWEEWYEALDELGAKDMPHKDIAAMLFDKGLIKDGWWCQSVTVGYEQHTGRREAGQRNDGKYETSVSKTFAARDLDDALLTWLHIVKDLAAAEEVLLKGEPTTSSSEKWRYWHAKLSDGGKVDVTITMKEDGKATLGLAHGGLPDKKSIERWNTFWKDFLKSL